MSIPSSSSPPTHNILFTIPRTASNLVTQLLNLPAQPSISRHPRDGYFFLPALSYRYKHDLFKRPIEAWANEEQNGMRDALRKSFAAWETWVKQADRMGKDTFIKEHINWMLETEAESDFLHGSNEDVEAHNPTCIPDTFLLTTNVRATFLIRHPALTFPSLLRTAIDNEAHSCPSHDPIILDASDLSNQDLVRKYAAAVDLNPELVRFEWDAVSAEEQQRLGSVDARMKDTLLNSRGMVEGKLLGSGEVDVESEKRRWREELGEVLGRRVERLVEGAMGDYGWLWERRLRV